MHPACRCIVLGLYVVVVEAYAQKDTFADSITTLRDTLQLQEHVTRAQLFRHDRGIAATSTGLDSTVLSIYERSSLQGALAWVPGVQMDTRGLGGSARLNIRGSMLRGTFGVRGVKVYWGPFPITLADGTTPLELLDPVIVADLDVVRSLASPVYGSAPAGLVVAGLPVPVHQGEDLSATYTSGSFGFHRAEAAFASSGKGRFISLGGVLQTNDGYRDQEASNKQQAYAVLGSGNDRRAITCALTYQSTYWELPGSLDSLTAYHTSNAANGWSRRINAHVDKSQIFAGIHARSQAGRTWLLSATVTGQYIDKTNPYGTSEFFSGLKREIYQALGSRLSAAGKARSGQWLFGWELGGEGLLETDDLLDRAYNGSAVLAGKRTDAHYRIGNATPYVVAQVQYRDRFWFFAGLGTELNSYISDDRQTSRIDREVGHRNTWPHAAVRIRLIRAMHLHVRYAHGVSRPTVLELWNGTALNTNVQPELVREIELALHVNSADSSWRSSVVGYRRAIENRIFTSADIEGKPTTMNAGSAMAQGIEADGSWRCAATARRSIILLAFAAAQMLNGTGADDMDPDERLAGAPLFTGGISAQLQDPRGWQLRVGIRHTGDTPAQDGSDLLVEGAMLCSARISYIFQPLGWAALEFFLSGENLLDEQYSGWVQLNDPNGRYYNPAPGRSFFGGVRVRLR